jgi:hypothetical protein
MSKKTQQNLSRKKAETTKDSFQFSQEEVLDYSISQDSDFNPTSGETALWRAVITQALMDAGNQSKKTEMRYEQSRAVSWLSGLSEDFKTVCVLANLDPVHVRQKSHDAIIRGCTWRKDIRLKERFAKLKSCKSCKVQTKIEIPQKNKSAEIILLAI